jgi:hypothetical protein
MRRTALATLGSENLICSILVARGLDSRRFMDMWRLKAVRTGFGGGIGRSRRDTKSCARLLSSGSRSRSATGGFLAARVEFMLLTKARYSCSGGG